MNLFWQERLSILVSRPVRSFFLSVPSVLLAAALPCSALGIRGYNAAIHDRFTGFPFTPVMNPGFLYDASRFTGVGWCNQASYQEFTLVTPSHFLCANHTFAKPSLGNTVRFVGKDGTVFDRTITVLTNISNDSGGNSDLVVGTLDSPLPASVVPLPWLNLGNGSEKAYQGTPLIVLGFFARGGAATLTGFQTLNEAGEIDDTRESSFSYNSDSGGTNDCYFEGGDSGSPTFGTAANGEPALVGTHSAASSPATTVVNYDCFLPHYVTKVDAFLATAGYRVRPATASATTVALTSAPSAATLRQAHAGGATFTVTNTGPALTGNVELTLTFPSGTAPDSVIMPGWVVEPRGSGVWSLRIATLAAGANGTATATWASLPAVASIPIATTLDSDATALVSAQTALALLPSYAAWSAGLADAGQSSDPDGDGVSNLIEYALGGDPSTDSLTLPSGQPLLPQIALTEEGNLDFSFPERTDAADRGLSYVVETSTDLLSWSTTLPVGNASSTVAFDPAIDGFTLQHWTWPLDFSPVFFVRLRVELNEAP
jgi:hypothetical protein